MRIDWTDTAPFKPDPGDAYYFVRRKDRLDVVVMGFSMGKGWLNGIAYEPSELRNHLFLGPLTPELFWATKALRDALIGYLKEHATGTRKARCYCLLCERSAPLVEDAAIGVGAGD